MRPRDIVANDLDCDVVVNKFKFESRYYVHFWTNTLENPTITDLGVRGSRNYSRNFYLVID